MTVDIRAVRRRTRSSRRFAEVDTLEQLPTRMPPAPPEASARLKWSLVATDRYEVSASGETIGFIDIAGAVFVALAGHRYDQAVEAAQTLVFEDALCALEQSR
jgi:hypothetical protein